MELTMEDTYIEHKVIADQGGAWRVTDATTVGGLRAHDNVVAVSLCGSGELVSRWMTPDAAESFARGILAVVESHRSRHV